MICLANMGHNGEEALEWGHKYRYFFEDAILPHTNFPPIQIFEPILTLLRNTMRFEITKKTNGKTKL